MKGWAECNMEVAFLIIGLLLGGVIGITLMCLFQINHNNDTLEEEIKWLKERQYK